MNQTPSRHVGTHILGLLLSLAGVAAIGTLLLLIVTHPDVRAGFDTSLGEARPSWILAILDRFGLLVPGITLSLGTASFLAGLRVSRRDAATLRMTRDAASWLTLALAVITVARLAQGATPWPDTNTWIASFSSGLVGPLVATLATLAIRTALARTADDPELPQEPLPAREMRSAWNLLIPAILILVMVAARPLEATIITSFTDKRFASDEVPNFVGLQHYRELLTLRIDEIECRRDDAGTCATGPDGTIR